MDELTREQILQFRDSIDGLAHLGPLVKALCDMALSRRAQDERVKALVEALEDAARSFKSHGYAVDDLEELIARWKEEPHG